LPVSSGRIAPTGLGWTLGPGRIPDSERIGLLNGSEIFRKVALDRLASPERLDTLLGFAFPRLWLVVAAGGALALALALWWLAGRSLVG